MEYSFNWSTWSTYTVCLQNFVHFIILQSLVHEYHYFIKNLENFVCFANKILQNELFCETHLDCKTYMF